MTMRIRVYLLWVELDYALNHSHMGRSKHRCGIQCKL